jgi:uncharacterized protein (TIGR00369 family)
MPFRGFHPQSAGRHRAPMSERTRTVEWEDPVAAAAAGQGLSGRDYLERLLAGEIPPPPIARLLGMDLVAIGEGSAVFALRPGEHLYNPLASVHGGVIGTMLDSAMSCAVHTLVPAGRGYTTAELKINFVRPITRETPLVRAEGRVIHPGRQLATAEGRLVDESGRLYAHGTATCLIFEVVSRQLSVTDDR